ncbi:MAG: ribonuclease P protein component [Patescibacteria group bacterium]
MISAKNRFHGRKNIVGMYNNASVIRTKEFQLRYKPKKPKSDFKVAIVVSKKTAKTAVVRNRIRRRLYEWVRLNVPATYEYDIMLTVFDEGLSGVPSETLQKQLKEAFAKVKPPTGVGKSK